MRNHLPDRISRRSALKLAAAGSLAGLWPISGAWAQEREAALITKAIPSTGEEIPVVGIGTSRRYNNPTEEELPELRRVLEIFPRLGGSVIDTAPGYGNAETVVGDLVAEIGNRDALFLATKVNARGREAGKAQIEQSFRRLKTDKIDLIAVHNIVDTDTQLATLRDLKEAGRIRYLGITTSSSRQYADFEAAMKAHEMDFIQVDYAINNREAEERILPLAQEREMAVMVNLPFGRGRLFQAVQDQPLPEWAAEFDCGSWAQFFLKYIVSHPAVTCAIPGTARVRYVEDNMAAARGRLPDEGLRRRMERLVDER